MQIAIKTRKKNEFPNNDRKTVSFNDKLKSRLEQIADEQRLDLNQMTRDLWIALLNEHDPDFMRNIGA